MATGWLFEHGYAKEAARYFEAAGNSFRTMLEKPPCRRMLKYQDKPGMLPAQLQRIPSSVATIQQEWGTFSCQCQLSACKGLSGGLANTPAKINALLESLMPWNIFDPEAIIYDIKLHLLHGLVQELD